MNKGLLAILFSGVFTLGLIGCEQEGPAEEAGENIDQAAEQPSQAAEDAKENVKESMDDQ